MGRWEPPPLIELQEPLNFFYSFPVQPEAFLPAMWGSANPPHSNKSVEGLPGNFFVRPYLKDMLQDNALWLFATAVPVTGKLL
jgi:hypothetical protein